MAFTLIDAAYTINLGLAVLVIVTLAVCIRQGSQRYYKGLSKNIYIFCSFSLILIFGVPCVSVFSSIYYFVFKDCCVHVLRIERNVMCLFGYYFRISQLMLCSERLHATFARNRDPKFQSKEFGYIMVLVTCIITVACTIPWIIADSIFFFNSFVSVVLHLIVLVMVVALYRYNKRLHVYLAYKVDLRQRCQVVENIRTLKFVRPYLVMVSTVAAIGPILIASLYIITGYFAPMPVFYSGSPYCIPLGGKAMTPITPISKLFCVICGKSCPWKCYNVFACAACAIFFRRSVVNVYTYECHCPKTVYLGVPFRSLDNTRSVIIEDSVVRCKACRLQKCFDCNMAATQIRNLGRLMTHGSAETHLFALILDNVLKTCKLHSTEAINYLLKGDKTILQLASNLFTYKPASDSTPKHLRIWSSMMHIQNIKPNEIPALLESILYRLISRYSREIRHKIFDQVNTANPRIIQFHQLSLYMLVASHYE